MSSTQNEFEDEEIYRALLEPDLRLFEIRKFTDGVRPKILLFSGLFEDKWDIALSVAEILTDILPNYHPILQASAIGAYLVLTGNVDLSNIGGKFPFTYRVTRDPTANVIRVQVGHLSQFLGVQFVYDKEKVLPHKNLRQ